MAYYKQMNKAWLSTTEALKFLAERGIKISRPTLYNWAARNPPEVEAVRSFRRGPYKFKKTSLVEQADRMRVKND